MLIIKKPTEAFWKLFDAVKKLKCNIAASFSGKELTDWIPSEVWPGSYDKFCVGEPQSIHASIIHVFPEGLEGSVCYVWEYRAGKYCAYGDAKTLAACFADADRMLKDNGFVLTTLLE